MNNESNASLNIKRSANEFVATKENVSFITQDNSQNLMSTDMNIHELIKPKLGFGKTNSDDLL